MKNFTVQEANNLWCPMTRVAGTVDAIIINRGNELTADMKPPPLGSGCIAHKCMWWVPVKTTKDDLARGHCGMIRP